MYGETLLRSSLPKHNNATHSFKGRIIGQIIDSPIDFYGVPNGLALTLLEGNRPLQLLMKFFFYVYLYSSYPFTMRHYVSASKQFHEAPAVVPSLWLFSKVDSFMSAAEIEKVITKWEAAGIQCSKKCWEDSPHVLHFKRNSVEYLQLLDDYLETIVSPN